MELKNKLTVNTINANDTVVLTLESGALARIKKSDLANALADVMRTASNDQDGLLSKSLYNAIRYHSTNILDGTMAHANQRNGRPCLTVAFDKYYYGRYIIYVYWSNSINTNHRAIALAQSDGVELGVSNSLGTVTINGIPEADVIQYSFWF